MNKTWSAGPPELSQTAPGVSTWRSLTRRVYYVILSEGFPDLASSTAWYRWQSLPKSPLTNRICLKCAAEWIGRDREREREERESILWWKSITGRNGIIPLSGGSPTLKVSLRDGWSHALNNCIILTTYHVLLFCREIPLDSSFLRSCADTLPGYWVV